MNEQIDAILKEINNLLELEWRLTGKAVEHRDLELLELVGNLRARHDEIFAHVSKLKVAAHA